MKKCENCGGKIIFTPSLKGNLCQNCGSVFPVKYNYAFNKKDISKANYLEKDNFSQTLKSFKCKSCGATVMIDKTNPETSCPYCSESYLSPVAKKKLMYIDSIIPFEIEKNKALSLFKSELNKRFSVNKKVFAGVTEEDLKSTYINAFVFDFYVTYNYEGEFEYQHKNSDGDTITRYKKVSGVYSHEFRNITIEATSNLEQKELLSVMPYNYTSAVDFHQDFMNGYMLEYQDKILEKCTEKAENFVKKRVSQELLKKYNCDKVDSLSLNTVSKNVQYNYCLLPVYFVNKEYKDKKYRVIINGQTGKVGNLPISGWKVFLLILLSFGIVGAIILSIIFLS